MKFAQVCALLAAAPFSTLANAQNTAWLCISDQSVGFSNSSGSWSMARFHPGARYIIKASQQQGVAWEVRKFGDQGTVPDAFCTKTFTSAKILNCVGALIDFHFNAGTGRFMYVYSAGYWTYLPGDKLFGNDSGDTPFMEIGSCSAV